MRYCPVVQLATTGAWPSGHTQTPQLYAIMCYYCGDTKHVVNTPLQVLNGIIHINYN